MGRPGPGHPRRVAAGLPGHRGRPGGGRRLSTVLSSLITGDAGRFVCWALVGAAYAFGILGLLSIGIFVLPVAVIATWYLAGRNQAVRHMTGVVAGIGAPLFYIGVLNRGGPGSVCRVLSSGDQVCQDRMSPWPWLCAGLIFVLLGVAAWLFAGKLHRH